MTPIRSGMVHNAFAGSLAQTMRAVKNMSLAWFTVTGCTILPDARSMCLAKALAWNADKFVFIDDDISWDVADFQFLISHPVPVCTGAYAMRKREDHEMTRVTVKFLDDNRETNERGLIEIAACGMGFFCFTREVVEALRPHCVRMRTGMMPEDAEAHMRDWFPYGFTPTTEEGVFDRAGEDIHFCRRVRELGFSVWFDPAIRLGHHDGARVYKVDNLIS